MCILTYQDVSCIMSVMNRKLLIATAVIVIGLTGGIISASQSETTGATESPLVTEVSNHEAELKNHEARISNTENNVKDLQNKTDTPPSTNTVEVPVYVPAQVPPTDPTPAPPVPVTVTAYREVVINPDTSDCEYTYSDGTTYQFSWKTSDPQGSWQTDGTGQNGHWAKTTNTSGYCDNRAIGLPRVN